MSCVGKGVAENRGAVKGEMGHGGGMAENGYAKVDR